MTVSADRRRTLVFIPAWNEESAGPAALADAHDALPGADLLAVDDGSTDATVAVARDAGADVVSFGETAACAPA